MEGPLNRTFILALALAGCSIDETYEGETAEGIASVERLDPTTARPFVFEGYEWRNQGEFVHSGLRCGNELTRLEYEAMEEALAQDVVYQGVLSELGDGIARARPPGGGSRSLPFSLPA